MRPSLALSIGAVVAVLFGAALALLPVQMLSGFGLSTPTEAQILSRDIGVTLIGRGIINWLARDATGSALRGLLWGTSSSRSLNSSSMVGRSPRVSCPARPPAAS